jgi:hypothetical protein
VTAFKRPRRRRAGQLLLSVATPVGAGELGAAAAAAAVVQPADAAQARAQLLSVIRGGGDEAAVQAAIEWLAPFNPTSAPARSPELQGEWRLLWSSATAEVTKVRTQLAGAQLCCMLSARPESTFALSNVYAESRLCVDGGSLWYERAMMQWASSNATCLGLSG